MTFISSILVISFSVAARFTSDDNIFFEKEAKARRLKWKGRRDKTRDENLKNASITKFITDNRKCPMLSLKVDGKNENLRRHLASHDHDADLVHPEWQSSDRHIPLRTPDIRVLCPQHRKMQFF